MSVLSSVSRLASRIDAVSLLHNAWTRLSTVPGGKRAFSRLVGTAAPYTGSIGAQVIDVRLGYAEVSLRDRRRVHNHINSIHAAALANLAEMTGSLGIAFSIPEGSRFIPTGLSIEYVKKARGTITARCDCPVPGEGESAVFDIPVSLSDRGGDEVARATIKVLVGPK
jgi:uncharacterized protein (TIGR00369 family)